MKTLLLNRHAKSSWDQTRLTDFERPLNQRGIADAPVMAKRLIKKKQPIDLIISSPAVRAFTTAQIFAEHLNFQSTEIRLEASIYLAPALTLLRLVNEIPDKFDNVILFGHNPGMTDFANYLADANIGNMPTCGIAKITFDTDHWGHVSKDTGTLAFFDFPKNT